MAVVLLLHFGFIAVVGQGVHFSTCAHHRQHLTGDADDDCCPYEHNTATFEKQEDLHDENSCPICSFFHGLRHAQLPQHEWIENLPLEHSLVVSDDAPLKGTALKSRSARGPPLFS